MNQVIFGLVVIVLLVWWFLFHLCRQAKKKQADENQQKIQRIAEKEAEEGIIRDDEFQLWLFTSLENLKFSSFSNNKESLVAFLYEKIPQELYGYCSDETGKDLQIDKQIDNMNQVCDNVTENIILRDEIDEYFSEYKTISQKYNPEILKLETERDEKQEDALYKFVEELERRIPDHLCEKLTSYWNFTREKDDRTSIAELIKNKSQEIKMMVFVLYNFPLDEDEAVELNDAWGYIVKVDAGIRAFQCRATPWAKESRKKLKKSSEEMNYLDASIRGITD